MKALITKGHFLWFSLEVKSIRRLIKLTKQTQHNNTTSDWLAGALMWNSRRLFVTSYTCCFPTFSHFSSEATAICPAKHAIKIKVTPQMPLHWTINLCGSNPIACTVILLLILNWIPTQPPVRVTTGWTPDVSTVICPISHPTHHSHLYLCFLPPPLRSQIWHSI